MYGLLLTADLSASESFTLEVFLLGLLDSEWRRLRIPPPPVLPSLKMFYVVYLLYDKFNLWALPSVKVL